MMNQRNSDDPHIQLVKLVDFVLDDDLEGMPESQIRALTDGAVEQGRKSLEAADGNAARTLLESAKGEVVEFWSKIKFDKGAAGNAPADLKSRLDQFLARDPSLLDNMTLAARSGKPTTEQDLHQLIEDLEILQALSRGGKD